MSIITKHNLTMSGSRIMWVFWFLLSVILITSKASIPSPTEATSLCPCSCNSPLKDLQSYATSYSSSEEGSTSSLHFSSSSTFRSGFYGSSLCYCRCSTTKSRIYEMPHSKSYGSSISVSSFSVYPSSDTHSTYLRFNSGDFSLSQSSSSASTEIRISSSSSERPFNLYPSSSRSSLSFSPTSERSSLSTSPTSAFSITTGDVPLCPCPCQRISKESQASSSLYVYSSDRDRSSQYVVSSFCHCPCKGTSSIHFETSYTASSSSSADASLCTCPCNSVFKDLQSSLPAYATSSKSFSFLIPLSLDNSSSFTKASFSDGSISSKYYLSSSTSSHILDPSSCYCPCSGTPSSVYQTPFSSHAVEEYSCICPCELGLSDSQSSSFLYATTSVVNTSFASRISSSVTKALSNDERNSSQYHSFSSTSSSMPGSPLCYCRCSTASSTVYETSMYSFSSSESLCTCPCGPDSKNLKSSSWLHGPSSDARTASQFFSPSSHPRSGIFSSFTDDLWRDGSSSYLYFLSSTTVSSSISSSLLCYCPCTTTTSTIYQTAFSSSESLCTCPCGPDSRNLKSSSWLHGPSSDARTVSQFLSSSSHPSSGISSSFADDSWRDGSSSYLYFLSSTTAGSSISSSLLCYCPCTTTTSTIYQTGSDSSSYGQSVSSTIRSLSALKSSSYINYSPSSVLSSTSYFISPSSTIRKETSSLLLRSSFSISLVPSSRGFSISQTSESNSYTISTSSTLNIIRTASSFSVSTRSSSNSFTVSQSSSSSNSIVSQSSSKSSFFFSSPSNSISSNVSPSSSSSSFSDSPSSSRSSFSISVSSSSSSFSNSSSSSSSSSSDPVSSSSSSFSISLSPSNSSSSVSPSSSTSSFSISLGSSRSSSSVSVSPGSSSSSVSPSSSSSSFSNSLSSSRSSSSVSPSSSSTSPSVSVSSSSSSSVVSPSSSSTSSVVLPSSGRSSSIVSEISNSSSFVVALSLSSSSSSVSPSSSSNSSSDSPSSSSSSSAVSPSLSSTSSGVSPILSRSDSSDSPSSSSSSSTVSSRSSSIVSGISNSSSFIVALSLSSSSSSVSPNSSISSSSDSLSSSRSSYSDFPSSSSSSSSVSPSSSSTSSVFSPSSRRSSSIVSGISNSSSFIVALSLSSSSSSVSPSSSSNSSSDSPSSSSSSSAVSPSLSSTSSGVSPIISRSDSSDSPSSSSSSSTVSSRSSSIVSGISNSSSFIVALSLSSSSSSVSPSSSSNSSSDSPSSSSSSSAVSPSLSSTSSGVSPILSRSDFSDSPSSNSSSSTVSENSSSSSFSVSPSLSSSSSSVSPSSRSSSSTVSPRSSSASSGVSPSLSSSSSSVSVSSSSSSFSVSLTSSSSVTSSSVYSISPTSSSQIDPAATKIPSNLYPHGPDQKDYELRLEDTSFSYDQCLKINTDWTGFPFFTERHYKLYICRNGIIQLNYEWSWWWPRKFGIYWWFRNMGIIAPFWATTDTNFAFINGHSKVYYQVYRQTQETSNEILAMASKHVKSYTGGFDDFAATWVLVVTWEKLCPYVYYSYYYYYSYFEQGFPFNCPRSNTFQAVLITNGFNTFLMYNYPYGGIQWVINADPINYRYWTNYYGLPVAGWNAGNDGKDYINMKGSGTFGMYDLDKKEGNTGLQGRYFWRIDNSNGQGALEKCFSWVIFNEHWEFRYWYYRLIESDWEMACPCTGWQAWFDRGRFSWSWWNSWPDWCFDSRRSKFFYIDTRSAGRVGVLMRQQCCYSTQWEDWASLKQGPPDGGRVKVTLFYDRYNRVQTFYSDEQAYQYCCVDLPFCHLFYAYRPSDSCWLYRPPIRRWFWGDPHIKTLDGGNYTFNGLGEYTMVDAENGTFNLQARTKLAQGNSTTATIFSAGAAKEKNSSTIEVRVKDGGGFHILIDSTPYNGYSNLTNRTVEVGGNLSISKPEENCLQVSFPSTSSVQFCVNKEMMSFVVTLGDVLKNATKGLLGTWNDDPNDDFTLPDGTVLPSTSSLKEIHYGFGVKWQINQSQSLFTYADNESVATYSKPEFEPMFADNITWHNDSLRQKAEAQCGDDHECLFDVASTNDLSVGMVTKDISVQLVNESNTLDNFPPKIVNASNLINATLDETVELNVTAEDEGSITFHVINKPAGATWNQTGNMLSFHWPVTSSQKFNMTFVATDDKGASVSWSPTIRMCTCQHGGQCVEPEEGDTANTDNKFIYMGCACQGGYTGRFCDSDIDACEMNGQPCYAGVECIDLPAPANSSGYKCGPCPSGYTGNGAQCTDYDECQSNSSNNCEQICVNIPTSFFCECRDGYSLNEDGRSCDDVDECNPSSDCMQKCINSEGSYNCSCNEFFKTDPSDWRKCVAEKSCSSDHGCEHVCFQGSNNEATCTCFANYELDSNEKNCTDINECDPAKELDRCNQICTNTPGSYKCSCEKGFELKKDGYECEDINECLNDDLFNCTDEFHKCVNTRGSYKCECDQDLYFIDGKCKGLEKNETVPIPDLAEPRVPSQNEKQEAVQFSILSGVEWDFDRDKSFKEKLASATSEFCSKNRTTCSLKEKRRRRRSPFLDLYTADQVHLLPGYPSNSSDSLQVAFYVQQPAGLFIGNISVLPRDALVAIVKAYKPEIEAAIGANISDIETLFESSSPTEYPTVRPLEPNSNGWKWIVIGISVGLVVLIAVIIIIVFVCFKMKVKSAVHPDLNHKPEETEEGIVMESYRRSSVKRNAWPEQPRPSVS